MSIQSSKTRAWLYRELEPSAYPGIGLSRLNKIIVWIIIMAVLVTILETEDAFRAPAQNAFWIAELFIALIFSIEYLARLYAAGEDERYSGFKGRIKYVFSWWSLIDLLAILPFILSAGASNAFLIRVLKFLRILRLARLGRFSQAWLSLSDAIFLRRFELALSGMVAFMLMLVSSTLLYVLEGQAQPEQFGSIPRAFWWSVATLTTVGYGDVTPITVMGRIFAGMTAIAGIGLIAMPTGILAAALSDAMQKHNDENKQ